MDTPDPHAEPSPPTVWPARIDGGRLATLRVGKGLASSEDLGRLAGVSGSTVRRLERGECRPTVATAHRIARVLRVSVDQLCSAGDE